ncbi:MAG: ABC transporter ATP-binding protein [Lachnospiraceae bacterium]|nr:ABC transporter ATP-binding protein [Lachnospiraceae bacterium]
MILELEKVTKRYGGIKDGVTVLTDVSLKLKKGEILGIVGESGSGKSTLLKMISGLEAPDSGEIRLHGKCLTPRRSREEYRTIQMVFQDASASFHPKRTIEASVREALQNLCGRSAKVDREALAGMVGLSAELMERRPGQLSGGQCQRFAIARAIAPKPEILLCDEITSALDVSTQARILNLVSKICRETGTSVIFVSHDLAVVSCLCDRIAVMKDGAIVEEGEVRQIIENPKEAYTKKLISSVMEI